MRRLTSRAAHDGTMQNAHELSQPIWMVTHAEWSASRRAGQRRRVRLVLLEDLDDRALEAGPLEQRRRVGQVVGAEHDVDVRRPLDDELAVLLGQAPADRDLQVGALLLQRLQAAEVAVELVVGVLPDAARVEHDDVGRRRGRRWAPCRRPRAARRCARSRARSSGSRRCAR